MTKPKQIPPNTSVSLIDTNTSSNSDSETDNRAKADTIGNKQNNNTAIGNIDTNKEVSKSNSDRGEASEYEHFVPQSAEEALALDIVNSLGERKDNLPLFIHYCKKYPRPIIERAWGEARQTPPSKIKKSRGALFNYLVQKYAKTTSDPGC